MCLSYYLICERAYCVNEAFKNNRVWGIFRQHNTQFFTSSDYFVNLSFIIKVTVFDSTRKILSGCLIPVLLVLKSLSPVCLSAILWTVTRWAPLSISFPRQEYWSGLPFPIPEGNGPNPGIEPASPVSCIAGGFFTHWAIGEASYLSILSHFRISIIKVRH